MASRRMSQRRGPRFSDHRPVTHRSAPIYGPEPWAVRAGHAWSHWDLWFCVVALHDGGGDLGRVEASLAGELDRPLLGDTRATESKLSHLTDLRVRLDAADLTPGALVGSAGTDARLVTKARHRVASDLDGRTMTEAMRETPRIRLQRRARFGSWAALPVSPQRFYAELRPLVEIGQHLPKSRTFGATRRLTAALRRLDAPGLRLDERIALYRAFHTAGLELAGCADDSYGNVGEMREAAWQTFLELDWRAARIGPALWWRDLCELLVWEPYALGHRRERLPFERARVEEVPLIESIFTDLAEEHEAVHLRWQADEARQQIAWLHVAQCAFDVFPRIAAFLGSEHWVPIDAMARTAIDAGRRDIALEVFRASDQPGLHQGHLRRLCRELTGVGMGIEDLPPRPALRVVPG